MRAAKPAGALEEWKALIGTYIVAQGVLARVDSIGLYEYRLPRVAATTDDIRKVEKSLEARLPDAYRNFLMCASGWPAFFNDIDLFGCRELLGHPLRKRAEEIVSATDESAFVTAGVPREDLVPIAVATEDIDVFVLALRGSSRGKVIWLAGGVIEIFDDFPQCFRAMLELLRDGVDELRHQVEELRAEGITRVQGHNEEDG